MNEKPQGERWCTMPHNPWCPECKREVERLRADLYEHHDFTAQYGRCFCGAAPRSDLDRDLDESDVDDNHTEDALAEEVTPIQTDP